MEPKLLELRRYAIDNRLEIRFSDPGSGRACLINVRGQVRIPGDDKDVRIEEVLAAAERFELIGGSTRQQLARDELAEAILEAFKKRGFAAAVKEEE
jgi:hypothetical protein